MDANQSRRRVRDGQDPPASDSNPILQTKRPDNRLVYDGLPIDRRTFRLMRLEPSEDPDAPVSCTLSVVPFASRPRYNALSYLWGVRTADEAIAVNGLRFEVGENLLGALRFLRWAQVVKLVPVDGFWVDAICINQTDVDEKSAQLGVMGQIYFRASSVLVWLRLQVAAPRLDPDADGKLPPELRELTPMRSEVTEDLVGNEYWDRLWILQELGRARRIMVCFGPWVQSWEDFVLFVDPDRCSDVPSRGPIKLNAVIVNQKHLPLAQLLQDHAAARCSNILDKVYGLIGLASDAAGFPIDYRKTQFEVWRDTMYFINDPAAHKVDVIAMARLVKELLAVPVPQDFPTGRWEHADPSISESDAPPLPQPDHQSTTTPAERNNKEPTMHMLPEPSDKKVIRLDVVIIGIICVLGPQVDDCIAEPGQFSRWRDSVQRACDDPRAKQEALRENDKLFSALLDLDQAETSRLCSSRPVPILWNLHTKDVVNLEPDDDDFRLEIKDEAYALSAEDHAPQLCFLNSTLPPDEDYSAPRLAVVPGVARSGNSICWVENSTKALVVQTIPRQTTPFFTVLERIKGVATVSDSITADKIGCSEPRKELQEYSTKPAFVDAETLFQLVQ